MSDIEQRLCNFTIKLEKGETITTQEAYDLALLAYIEIRSLRNEQSVLKDKLLHSTS